MRHSSKKTGVLTQTHLRKYLAREKAIRTESGADNEDRVGGGGRSGRPRHQYGVEGSSWFLGRLLGVECDRSDFGLLEGRSRDSSCGMEIGLSFKFDSHEVLCQVRFYVQMSS